MISALLMAAVAGILVGGYISLVLKENREVDRAFLTQAASRLASAGLETGILALNQQEWSQWEFNVDWAKRVLPSIRMGKNAFGTITVEIDALDTLEPILTSEGAVALDSGETIKERIEVVLKSSPLFGNAITGSEAVVFDGGGDVSIDSFDSSLGLYDAYFNRGDHGTVAGGMIAARPESNASIYGFLVSNIDRSQLRTGSGRSASLSEHPLWLQLGTEGRLFGADTPNKVDVDLNRIVSEFDSNFYAVRPPEPRERIGLPPFETSVNMTGDLYVVDGLSWTSTETVLSEPATITIGDSIISESYWIEHDFVVAPNQILEIRGKVTIVVEGSVDIQGLVHIMEPQGALSLFVEGDFSVGGEGIENSRKRADKLVVYGTSGDERSFRWGGDRPIHGAIYAPFATVDLYGYFDGRPDDGTNHVMYGAVTANTVNFFGGFGVHYDEQLGNFSGAAPLYIPQEWQPLNERVFKKKKEQRHARRNGGEGQGQGKGGRPGIDPEGQLTTVLQALQSIVDANPGTPLADKIEDVVAKVQTALDELNKIPPDIPAALGNIEGALGDLDAAKEIDPAQGPTLTDLMDQLSGVALGLR